MIRTGAQYRDSIRDGRAGLDRRRARQGRDDPSHVQAAGRYPRAHSTTCSTSPRRSGIMSYADGGENPRDRQQAALYAGRTGGTSAARPTRVLEEIGGVVTRVGDETVGEMWSLFDGQDVLNEVDPQFSENIRNHVGKVLRRRSVPRLGQHRPKGRSVQAAAGAGSGHAAACREGDGRGHRRARREIRDGRGLCQPGIHQAHDRQLGKRCAVGLRGRASSAISIRPTSNSSAARALPAARPSRTIRWPTASTRSMRW